jgi:ankyrin repeat protein
MSKQKEFERAFKLNNVKLLKLLLKDKDVDPSKENNYAICYSSENGYLDIVKLLIQDKRVDPSDYDNWAIGYASQNGHSDIVKLLLLDPRVDPSDCDNWAIHHANESKYFDIVKLLWNNNKVKKTLEKNDPSLYAYLIKKDIVIKLRQFNYD